MHLCIQFLSAGEKANVTITLKNLPTDAKTSLYISMDSVVYYEIASAKATDTFSVDLKEPVPAMLIVNNALPSNKLFWIHEGEFELQYDVKDYSLSFINSPLNSYNQRITFIRDSINYLKKQLTTDLHLYMDKSMRQKDSLATLKLEETYTNLKTYQPQIDSLDKIADAVIYNYHFKNPKSFLALDFVKAQLKFGNFDKHKLRILFALLPESLKNYPSYNESKALLENYFPKTQPNGRSPLTAPK